MPRRVKSQELIRKFYIKIPNEKFRLFTALLSSVTIVKVDIGNPSWDFLDEMKM